MSAPHTPEKKLYSKRNAIELDAAGGYYFKHVLAMTAEDLHSKSDIAMELGHRDHFIAQLEQQRDALQAKCDELINGLCEIVSVAERCDSWESFPSHALDKANLLLIKAQAGAQ